jgi:hypothetical protein
MITLGVQPKDGGSSPLLRSNLSLPLFGGVFFKCHPWPAYSLLIPLRVLLQQFQSYLQHL